MPSYKIRFYETTLCEKLIEAEDEEEARAQISSGKYKDRTVLMWTSCEISDTTKLNAQISTKISQELMTILEKAESIRQSDAVVSYIPRLAAEEIVAILPFLIDQVAEMEREVELSRMLSCNAPGTTRGKP